DVYKRQVRDCSVIVDRPGPGTLVIRAALTHLKPTGPAANVATTILIGVPLDVAEAAVEARFADALTGQTLAELTTSSKGSIVDFARVWRRWDQVHHAFDLWVQRLRTAMTEGR
ncbi:MAG: DUF3313 domain-containing protein, partial [Syntrophales bacterium]|nr:DUF3313 domain-containing protein [Syntrophales bacterium]